jgi:hypothetical protein
MEASMRERPILFSGPMVRAILAGRKTQTRRLMTPPPSEFVPNENRHPPRHAAAYFDAYCSEARTESNPRGMSDRWCWWTPDDRQGPDWIRCPYGAPGDRLWVRETWRRTSDVDGRDDILEYKAGGTRLIVDSEAGLTIAHGEHRATSVLPTWKPSIYLPRWASRITLEVAGVRVERLQAISEADAVAEGVDGSETATAPQDTVDVAGMTPARGAFACLWESINGKRAPWASNPWVWVVEFKRLVTERR